MTVKKERLYIILTETYIDALNLLVEKGIYLERTVVIRDALRRLFRFYKIEPFYQEEIESFYQEPVD